MTERPKVLVLGHRGMLGHVVRGYLLQRGFSVELTEARFQARAPETFARALATLDFGAVVNCIGRKHGTPSEIHEANSALPCWLASTFTERLLVHASTDGVFSGASGPASVSAIPDAKDPYGASKRAAERCLSGRNAVILRCSLIGPELATGSSLLAWLSRQAAPVTGFSDQLWNGVTTLTWARLCERALVGELASGLHQPACANALSKAELLRAIAAQFAPHVVVESKPSGHPLDRRLAPTVETAPMEQQLQELAEWYAALARSPLWAVLTAPRRG